MKSFLRLGLLFLSIGVHASDVVSRSNELKVSLLKKTVESIAFDKTVSGSIKGDSISYYVGKDTLRSRVVPEAMYQKMKDTFPVKDSTKTKSDCRPTLSIERNGKSPQFVCDESLTKRERLALSKWFRETRLKLME